MTSNFDWELNGLDEGKFQAWISLLRLRNGGQLQSPSRSRAVEASGIDLDLLDLDRSKGSFEDDDDSMYRCEFEMFDDARRKKKFLDRLSGIIANAKGGGRVTSTLLVEWPGYAKVTIVSRNQGLTDKDRGFLAKLRDSIRVTAASDESGADQQCTSMWIDIIEHYKERIKKLILSLQPLYKEVRTVSAAANTCLENDDLISGRDHFTSLIEEF